jgi:hypothetical protein
MKFFTADLPRRNWYEKSGLPVAYSSLKNPALFSTFTAFFMRFHEK